ncbi:hypothetical protein Vretifemale_12803, partial [Volvox reticuliferus]
EGGGGEEGGGGNEGVVIAGDDVEGFVGGIRFVGSRGGRGGRGGSAVEGAANRRRWRESGWLRPQANHVEGSLEMPVPWVMLRNSHRRDVRPCMEYPLPCIPPALHAMC